MENVQDFELLLQNPEDSVRDRFSAGDSYDEKRLKRFIFRACNAAYLGSQYRPKSEDASIFVDGLLQLSIEIADSLPANAEFKEKRHSTLSEVAAMLDFLNGISEKSLADLHPDIPKIKNYNAVPDIVSAHAKVWTEIVKPEESTAMMLNSPQLTTMTFIDEHNIRRPKLSEGHTDVHSTVLDLLDANVVDRKKAELLALTFGTAKASHIDPSRRIELRKRVMSQLNERAAIVFNVPDDKKAELQLGRKYLGIIAREYPINESVGPIDWLSYRLNDDESLELAVATHLDSHVSFALAVIMRND